MEKPDLNVETLTEAYKTKAAVRASWDIVLDLLFKMAEDDFLHPEKIDFSSMSPELRAELEKIASFFASGKTATAIALVILDARHAIATMTTAGSEPNDQAGNVTYLTNRRRLELIEKRIIRKTRKNDPHCFFYNPEPLFDELMRQIKDEERAKDEK